MLEIQENLRFSDSRIVAVSSHPKFVSGNHLHYIYYSYPIYARKGFRNFFNVNSNVMTCAKAQKYLDWSRTSFNRNKILTLHIFPSRPLLNCFGKSEAERGEVFQSVIREAVKRLLVEANLFLKWIAAVDASRYQPRGIVVIPKTVFDVETRQFKTVKNCFPRPFLERNEPKSENTNFVEKIFAQTFFDIAAQDENFENRIDDLIEVSRRYKFQLPVNYYAFR